MSINAEIICLGKKFNANTKIIAKADYFLRKLNRKSNGSLGAADMLKYLICVDLAYRDYKLQWDESIAKKLGLKHKKYHNTFNKIQNKLNITKNKCLSFDELCIKYKCKYIRNRFENVFKKYQTLKLSNIPLVQRRNTNLATTLHKTAIFYVTATKFGKIRINPNELCNIMRCEHKKFDLICSDIRKTCFPPKNITQNRKRKRNEMENDDDDDIDNDNDDVLSKIDGYETRKERKHKEWKEKVMQSNENLRKKRRISNNNPGSIANKVKIINNNNNSKPTKMFPLFAIAKKQNKNNNVDDIKDSEDDDQDIDLMPENNQNLVIENNSLNVNNNNMENINNSNQNKEIANKEDNNTDNNKDKNNDKNLQISPSRKQTAQRAAALAAMKRYQQCSKPTVANNNNNNDNNE